MKVIIAGADGVSAMTVSNDRAAVKIAVEKDSATAGMVVWIDPKDADVVCAAIKAAAKECNK